MTDDALRLPRDDQHRGMLVELPCHQVHQIINFTTTGALNQSKRQATPFMNALKRVVLNKIFLAFIIITTAFSAGPSLFRLTDRDERSTVRN